MMMSTPMPRLLMRVALLVGGLAFLDFEIGAGRAAFTIAAAIGAQWLFTRLFSYVAALRGRPAMPFEWRSAAISGLSRNG